jgi:hypothetical protein
MGNYSKLDTGRFIINKTLYHKDYCNAGNIMCEERVVGLQSILRSLATRVPRIILQGVEEMFPAVRESMVSALCMCAQKRIVLSSSVYSGSQRNKHLVTNL